MDAKPPIRVLVVDDEANHVRALCDTLGIRGYAMMGCCSAEEALAVLRQAQFELLLADLIMPGTGGIELVQAARALDPDLACIIMTGEGSIASAVQAMQVGALDYILKPCKLSAILPVLARAIATRQLRIDNAALERQVREHAAVLAALNVDLEQARREAERSNEMKSVFLATMSHELRTPLNAILGFAQILNSETLPSTPAQKKQFVGHILQAGKHLLVLINEVLDLARVESGTLTVSIEPVALASVLTECAALVAPLADRGQIALSFPTIAGVHVLCDRIRLKQVMINILSNAIKYNREHGSVTVSCELADEGKVRIGVRDTGAGLDATQLAHLFEPFNRLGRDAGVEEGTGIGLALTRHLVELMGGVISVESRADVGSTFWVTLPLSKQIALPVAPADGGAANGTGRTRASRTISTLLYIEDNPGNLRLVEEIVLPRADLRLLSAPDGHTGIALARQHLPHVILVDINLPGIDGYEIRRLLRADPRTARIPVIAVSASAMPSDVARGKEAGFYCYLTKPIDIDIFSDAIDRALVARNADTTTK
ncbi:response regulator [Massilia sp. P8910]|uniref:ATP-binding response regulator n=1 Tax=Massilia antarctica TaxID=2765360 RepID=UPI001E2B6AD4|nr:response regulator [Massilia antarctica]MCE3602451.1 response regulator [Massilia antarctica]